MVGSVFARVAMLLLDVLSPRRPVPSGSAVPPDDTVPRLLGARGYGMVERTSYSPAHGDSHAFLGTTYTTRGQSNNA